MNACNKPKCECRKDGFVFRKVVIPAQLGDDETGQDKPANGAMTNSFVTYEANGAQYIYDSFGVYTKFNGSDVTIPVLSVNGKTGEVVLTTADLENTSDYVTGSYVTSAVGAEAEERIAADGDLQSQIDAITVSSDVKDIVGTHADLENYDTSKLGDNDIIKVLQDETQDDETTYYRWSTSTETFTLIGAEGPYYTKSAADQKFQDKLTAGDHITIDSSNVISADGQTIFYANSQEAGATRHIYKDATFTQVASAQDLLDANEEGPVVLRITINPNPDGIFSDAYIQNTYVGENDYQFLFLDERTYREYAASAPSDTTFYYFSNTIQSQLTAGTNVQINGDTISATDTTYSDFTGTDGVEAGTAGLVPAPATTDAGKYLKADGTWDTVSAGPTVVQTTGTSTTDVMSQNATTSMVFQDPSTQRIVRIGSSNTTYDASGVMIGKSSEAINTSVAIGEKASATGFSSVAIGEHNNMGTTVATKASGNFSIAIGGEANATKIGSIAIGGTNSNTNYTRAIHDYSTALGFGSRTGRNYETSIGSGQAADAATYKERYLANVKDPSLAQDAATKNYVDTKAIGTDETYTIADTDWTALSGASPYTYSADVTATYTIGNDTIVELINDAPVLFSTYGFAIGAVSSQTVTIYSVGAPSSSVSLTINYKG